ncbi:unnamed protein product, partial [Polarella glacialis]
DPTFAKMAVRKDGRALEFASAEIRANKDLVILAVAQCGTSLLFASDELRADKEVVLKAAAQDATALLWASEENRADRDVWLACAPDRHAYWKDEEYVLKELEQNEGTLLAMANIKFQQDPDVVLRAVAQDFYALEFAAKLQHQ